MQPVENPNKGNVLIFSVVGVVGLVTMVAGFMNGIDDWGLYGIVFGGIATFHGEE